jgi:hypothetical protein
MEDFAAGIPANPGKKSRILFVSLVRMLNHLSSNYTSVNSFIPIINNQLIEGGKASFFVNFLFKESHPLLEFFLVSFAISALFSLQRLVAQCRSYPACFSSYLMAAKGLNWHNPLDSF